MTILQALNAFYDRLDARGDAPKSGYALVGVSFAIPIDSEGRVEKAIDIRAIDGRHTRAVDRMLPKLRDHSNSGKDPFLFWDKTAFALGVTKSPLSRVTPLEQFQSFREANLAATEQCESGELLAFRKFLENWNPDDADQLGIDETDYDTNVVFRFIETGIVIHETEEAREIWARHAAADGAGTLCLVTGRYAPQARLHPKFPALEKGGSRGPIVSFKADAFKSYGKSQGANAPVSEEVAFRYGAALNWLLDRDNGRSLRLGETTVVYWADAKGVDEILAKAAEDSIGNALDPRDEKPRLGPTPPDDEDDAGERDADREHHHTIGSDLRNIRELRRAPDGTEIPPNTRMHILGLSPNAGRIAVRFWLVDTFGTMAGNLERFIDDMSILPSPFRNRRLPKFRAFLLELVPYAVRFQPKKVEALFASKWAAQVSGEFFIAVLTGRPLPATILSNIISRIRSDGFVARKYNDGIDGARVALIVAAVNRRIRTLKERIPMELDSENTNPAYRLGRLFALIEGAQRAALPNLNATVKDRYFGAACATPARVIPLLHKNAMNHLSKVRKERGEGLAHWMDQQIGEVWSGLSPDLPRSLKLEDQARFIAGYYHQRFAKKFDGTPSEAVELLKDDPQPADTAA